MPLRIIPDHTTIPFMHLRRVTFPIAVLLTLLSAALFVFVGPDYGIDFRGGTVIEIKPVTQPADVGAIRSTLNGLGLGDTQVQEVSDPGGGSNVLIRIGQQEGGEEGQQAAVNKVRAAFGDTVEFRRVEVVGPRVSSELAQKGTIAMLATLAAIMVYVWFRFEWQFAIGSIISALNVVIMTMGFFAVSRYEFNLSSLAAILTTVGYSLNDTVVVYDRIRETLRKYKSLPIPDLIDRAINDTLARTIVTSVTTFLVLLALFLFGGDVIRSFTGSMLFGIVAATLSSIFVAAPILIYFGLRAERPEAAKAAKAPAEPAKTS